MPSDARIKTILAQAAAQIDSDSPRLDAEILLATALKKPRSYLYSWPERLLESTDIKRFEALLARRCQGEPVAYITGSKEFWTLELQVNRDVLIPRPETELLVETALTRVTQQPARVLDLGTGTGAIALALAHENPGWEVTATDVSNAALEIAQANAKRLGIPNVIFKQSHWYAALQQHECFDLIVSNPPYIAADDPHLQQGDVRFEPQTALTAGITGLDALIGIISQAGRYLQDQGWLMVEHGYNQAEAAYRLFSDAKFSHIQTLSDLGGNPRVTLGRKADR